MSGHHRAPAAAWLVVLVLLASATAFGPTLPSCADGISCTEVPNYFGDSTTAVSLNRQGANASGAAATAMGDSTTASAEESVAMVTPPPPRALPR